METQFENILAIIDRAAQSVNTITTLFQDQNHITLQDIHAFEEWSGNSFGFIKEIISPAYSKRLLALNPFSDDHCPASASLIFLRFIEDSHPHIFYSVENMVYGQIIIASTHVGICYLVFFGGAESKVPEILKNEFTGSIIINQKDSHQRVALAYLNGDNSQVVHLHVKSTSANFLIWEALTKVPCGKLISYGTLAKVTGHMARDIGVSMGDNRLAMLIPCHRVIKSTGELGQYHWGAKRKRAMIIREAIIF